MKNLLLLLAGISLSLLAVDLAEAGNGKGDRKRGGDDASGTGTAHFGSETSSTEDVTVWLVETNALPLIPANVTKKQLVRYFGNGETIRPGGSGKTLRKREGLYTAIVFHTAYFRPAANNTPVLQVSPIVSGLKKQQVLDVVDGGRQRIRVNATGYGTTRATTLLIEPF